MARHDEGEGTPVVFFHGEPTWSTCTRRRARRPRDDHPEVIEDASHFLQEDAGQEIGRRIARWLAP